MSSKIIMGKGIILGAIVTGIISFGFFQHQTVNAAIEPSATLISIPEQTESAVTELYKTQDSREVFEYAAKKAKPAVVTVFATTMVKESQGRSLFDEFFNNRRFDRRRQQEPTERPQLSSGSGVIISKDGYIVTNFHVVENVDELTVLLSDKREYTAEIIGSDPLTDIALIKINAENLSPVLFGSSDGLKLGQHVLAVGNPLRIGLTVTTGIVSALKRNLGIIEGSYSVESFIQTDAVINRGNSGGALVDLKGNLVGINTAIYSGTGYYSGYGFAVPIKIVKHVIKELKKEGRVRRGYIGISLSNVDYKMAKSNSWKIPKGVYVGQVLENMPAASAGIKQDDIILSVDGVAVNEPNELQVEVSTKDYDAKVKLLVFRNGKTLNKTVKLRERTDNKSVLASVSTAVDIESLGMELQTISKRRRDELGTNTGLELVNVRRYSEAYEAGLRVGDVIFKVGNKNLKKVNDLTEYMKRKEKGDVIKLYVKQQSRSYKNFVYLEIK